MASPASHTATPGYTVSPPTALDQTVAGYHDQTIYGQATAEGGSGYGYTYSVVAPPTNDSQFDFNSDGSFDYVGSYHFYGTDQFTFNATDNQTGEVSNTATVTITVQETAPTVNPDEYTLLHDTSYSDNVLYNDMDAEGDPLTASLVSGPSQAQSFVLNPDGSFAYVPNAAYVGDDGFDYDASDGLLLTQAHVTIHVTDQPPVAADDGVDGSGNVIGVYVPTPVIGPWCRLGGPGCTDTGAHVVKLVQ